MKMVLFYGGGVIFLAGVILIDHTPAPRLPAVICTLGITLMAASLLF